MLYTVGAIEQLVLGLWFYEFKFKLSPHLRMDAVLTITKVGLMLIPLTNWSANWNNTRTSFCINNYVIQLKAFNSLRYATFDKTPETLQSSWLWYTLQNVEFQQFHCIVCFNRFFGCQKSFLYWIIRKLQCDNKRKTGSNN